ncbi:hypothetical protein C0J52_05458 [Blattella germanica]|nr:hypothetical protein C0J52_05458 [Blattella germanica]
MTDSAWGRGGLNESECADNCFLVKTQPNRNRVRSLIITYKSGALITKNSYELYASHSSRVSRSYDLSWEGYIYIHTFWPHKDMEGLPVGARASTETMRTLKTHT